MALPGPGPSLSMNDIGVEFGDSQPHSLSEFYRGGPLVSNYPPAGGANAGVPLISPTPGVFPTIAIGNFYGANNRNVITVTITGSTTNYNAYANRSASYFPGKTDITYVINPGVIISSPSTGSAAFSVPSEFAAGDTVTIINNGTIVGAGGAGGAGGTSPAPTAAGYAGGGGGSGGPALSVSRAVRVNNSGGSLLGGGGGGGGGSGAQANSSVRPARPPVTNPATFSGGGGGGGGYGGGSAGAGGATPAPGAATNTRAGTAGTVGTTTSAGTGGTATATSSGNTCRGGLGGNGGGAGSAGTAGTGAPATVPAPLAPNPFSPAVTTTGGGAGGAGNYISGNPSVTWIGPSTGTRLGGVG